MDGIETLREARDQIYQQLYNESQNFRVYIKIKELIRELKVSGAPKITIDKSTVEHEKLPYVRKPPSEKTDITRDFQNSPLNFLQRNERSKWVYDKTVDLLLVTKSGEVSIDDLADHFKKQLNVNFKAYAQKPQNYLKAYVSRLKDPQIEFIAEERNARGGLPRIVTVKLKA